MKTRPVVVFAVSFLLLLPACSANRAQQAVDAQQRQFALNTQAWMAARTRLKQMCPSIPKSVDEYKQAKAILASMGTDPYNGCDVRLVKMTNAPRYDDWTWDWLPSYSTMVAVHDEELRKRVAPKIYDEFILGIAKYVGVMADRGEITPFQLMNVLNEAWRWAVQESQKETILLQQNLAVAQQSDAAVWNGLGKAALGLAAVATVALGAAATVAAARTPTYVPVPTYTVQPVSRPINCFANRTSSSTVWVSCR
jgi:hypothetical protein